MGIIKAGYNLPLVTKKQEKRKGNMEVLINYPTFTPVFKREVEVFVINLFFICYLKGGSRNRDDKTLI